MDTSIIDIEIGLQIEPNSLLHLKASKSSSPSNSCIIQFHFPCREKTFARSLQVLLSPYFASWSPQIEIIEDEVVVFLPVSQHSITEEFEIELGLGMKIEGLKKNFLNDLLESAKLNIRCKDFNQLARAAGIEELYVQSGKLTLSIDPEDVPAEFLEYYRKELEKYLKYFEVLDAVRPFLRETCIKIDGVVGPLTVIGEIRY